MNPELGRAVSETRFATYLARSNGDATAAWSLYEWNLDISTAFMQPIAAVEITLRNALYDAASSPHGRNWLTISPHLRQPETQKISAARFELRRRNTTITPDAIVAELSMGFWVALLTNRYDQTLWRTAFNRAFGRPVQRGPLHDALDRVRTLRNRVAHHEHLLDRNLVEDAARIDRVLQMLSPTVAAWVASRSTINLVLPRRPVP